mmetsp:Transcript_17324/g.41247  ORF Transcript_17324/g.41247 Transcript_17324/m.41247 type:complete len:197 (-) Transcript_17324:30-620(-)
MAVPVPTKRRSKWPVALLVLAGIIAVGTAVFLNSDYVSTEDESPKPLGSQYRCNDEYNVIFPIGKPVPAGGNLEMEFNISGGDPARLVASSDVQPRQVEVEPGKSETTFSLSLPKETGHLSLAVQLRGASRQDFRHLEQVHRIEVFCAAPLILPAILVLCGVVLGIVFLFQVLRTFAKCCGENKASYYQPVPTEEL